MRRTSWLVISLLLTAAVIPAVSADPFFLWRQRLQATDCTALTDGKASDLCFEQDDQQIYICTPDSGDCDTVGEWDLVQGDAAAITGWTWDSGTQETRLTTSTGEVEIGSAGTLDAKVGINGDADEIQLLVQEHSTQTADVFVVEASDGTDLFGIKGTGEVDIFHTASSDDEVAVEIVTDAVTFADIRSLDIEQDFGALASGEDDAMVLLGGDITDTTGGDVILIEGLISDGSATPYFLKCGAELNCLTQASGSFANPGTATNNTDATQVLDMKDGSTGTNTDIFASNGDFIIIGASAAFTEIEFNIETAATGSGVKPIFAYSTSGAGQFTTFTPTDGTNRFRNVGVHIVAWEPALVSSPAHTTNDDTGTFDIRIDRNTVNTGTVSLFYAKTAATAAFFWNKDGDLLANSYTLATDKAITLGTTTLTEDSTQFDLVINNDVNIEESSPHWELRDTDSDVSYMWHNDTAETFANLTLWRGTNDGTGFLINPETPLMQFDNNNKITIGLGDEDILTGTSGGTVENVRPPTDLEADLGTATERFREGHIFKLFYADYASVTTTADATGSASEYNVFDEDNYSTFTSDANVTANNVTFTSTDGRFTVDNAGVYLISWTQIVLDPSSEVMAFLIKVNDSSVYNHSIFTHASTDPNSYSFSLIKALTANQYVTFHIDALAGSAVSEDGTTVTMYKLANT